MNRKSARPRPGPACSKKAQQGSVKKGNKENDPKTSTSPTTMTPAPRTDGVFVCEVDDKTTKMDTDTSDPVASTSRMSGGQDEAASTPPPIQDINAYYEAHGVTLSRVRRFCRIYYRYGGRGGENGYVYLDTFTPPPGFSESDLPMLEEKPSVLSRKNTVSPTILNAAKYKMKPRLPPLPTQEDHDRLMAQLMKRRASTPLGQDSDDSQGTTPVAKTPKLSEETCVASTPCRRRNNSAETTKKSLFTAANPAPPPPTPRTLPPLDDAKNSSMFGGDDEDDLWLSQQDA